jgi:hypothetical protein
MESQATHLPDNIQTTYEMIQDIIKKFKFRDNGVVLHAPAILEEEFGISTVTAISIDNTWSALRFMPIDKVGK